MNRRNLILIVIGLIGLGIILFVASLLSRTPNIQVEKISDLPTSAFINSYDTGVIFIDKTGNLNQYNSNTNSTTVLGSLNTSYNPSFSTNSQFLSTLANNNVQIRTTNQLGNTVLPLQSFVSPIVGWLDSTNYYYLSNFTTTPSKFTEKDRFTGDLTKASVDSSIKRITKVTLENIILANPDNIITSTLVQDAKYTLQKINLNTGGTSNLGDIKISQSRQTNTITVFKNTTNSPLGVIGYDGTIYTTQLSTQPNLAAQASSNTILAVLPGEQNDSIVEYNYTNNSQKKLFDMPQVIHNPREIFFSNHILYIHTQDGLYKLSLKDYNL